MTADPMTSLPFERDWFGTPGAFASRRCRCLADRHREATAKDPTTYMPRRQRRERWARGVRACPWGSDQISWAWRGRRELLLSGVRNHGLARCGTPHAHRGTAENFEKAFPRAHPTTVMKSDWGWAVTTALSGRSNGAPSSSLSSKGLVFQSPRADSSLALTSGASSGQNPSGPQKMSQSLSHQPSLSVVLPAMVNENSSR